MSIHLKPHNIETYQKVTDKFRKSNRVAVIHPTGTGKMFVALKLLEENNNKKAIYVAPSNPILHDVKKNIFAEGMTMEDFPLLKRITYQKLMNMSDEEIEKLQTDIIILDEFHHCGAPEWGKGAERLIKRNEGAKILGLSATPLRYLDGLRDMAEELFENNIASEMTLEEAIEKGILPEATYVSTLYGYDKAVEDMQIDIDKIDDKEKREQAQSLVNNLKEKLDKNTQDLPKLFSEYMQNKNGKYIVFCRNIDDMNEKIKQAHNMFGKVNSNITVRAVSSKIKESDKILTKFEQDNNGNTLKLLYTVDMLNEGYHINDLDGVIMMRPTFSPTVYTQQLGRALTVGENKKPVILDLVNNFDSCKVIEDFAEKMKQYKNREGNRKREGSKSSRLSIFDKTKEFREIAEKITSLSKKRTVPLAEKVEIFEKFAQTGEVLAGNTIFEGYPIGKWAIQIRNSLNRVDKGEKEKGKINLTEEQLSKLEELGILERQFDSTLDEKINYLVEWRTKYPKIRITPTASKGELRDYVNTDEEYKKIQEEYKKVKGYYKYIRERKSHGKLSEEQVLKCKEGDVGGVFGYPSRVKELAKKYDITEKEIDYILQKYETIENFYEIHKTGRIKGKKDKVLAETIIRDVIGIDGNFNSNYDDLYRKVTGKNISKPGLSLYSCEELKKSIDELFEMEKIIIIRRYDLTGEGLTKNLKNIGEEFRLSKERIRQIELKALAKLRKTHRISKYKVDFNQVKNSKLLTDEERQQITEIEKDIQLQNGDVSKKLEFLRTIKEELRIREEHLTNRNLEDIEIDKSENLKIQIEELELSTRATKCLRRTGIKTINDLSNITYERLIRTRNLGLITMEEIMDKMREYGISFKEEKQESELEDTTDRRLHEKVNEDTKNEEKISKQELLHRILEQQRIIEKQQREIDMPKSIMEKNN